MDIYDLADKIRLRLIEENQLFFKTYFKLENDPNVLPSEEQFQYDTNLAKRYYNNQHIDYHIEFFKAGFNAVVKKWLEGGCKESPEEMYHIIMSEYNK